MRILSVPAILLLLVTVYANFDTDVQYLRDHGFATNARALWERNYIYFPGVSQCLFLVHLVSSSFLAKFLNVMMLL